ncbi:hypothetical protein [Paenibacillus sp. Y412MC10]|uniref:hypothetical protein n=1 Tax=Geobacillus sp. (strain Y412MC10) TaxID=481743 RepID=UPI0011A06C61|nr:hypothetical protein [Paenibacillus sp. Y412MC10]
MEFYVINGGQEKGVVRPQSLNTVIEDIDLDIGIPEAVLQFSMDVMGREHEVWDYNYKRICIEADGKEFLIRMWDHNLQTGSFKWTLYKIVHNPDGARDGEELKRGYIDHVVF